VDEVVNHNMLCFHWDPERETTRLSARVVASFVLRALELYVEAARRQGTEVCAYAWNEGTAGQLRISAVPHPTEPPFAGDVCVVDTPRSVAVAAMIGALAETLGEQTASAGVGGRTFVYVHRT
jgi:hypothetical protein